MTVRDAFQRLCGAALLAVLLPVASSGCGSDDGSSLAGCTVSDEEDGVFIRCDDGTDMEVPSGCTVEEHDDGTATIECDDGTSTTVGPPDGDHDVDEEVGETLELLAGVTAVGSNDGVATRARMDGALHAVISPEGEFLYFVDTFNRTVRRLGLVSGEVVTLAGRPGVEGADDGVGDEATFEGPRGVAIDPEGEVLYIADGFNCTLRTLEVATREVRTLIGEPRECGDVDGELSEARVALVIGMQMDPQGRYLYFADRGNNRIRRVDLDDEVVENVAGDTSVSAPERDGFQDGPGDEARFSGPGGIDVDDEAEFLYVNDTFNNVVRRVDLGASNFEVDTIAGTPGQAGDQDGVGDQARFAVSQGLAFASGSLFVAGFHNTIREIDAETFEVETVAGKSGADGASDGHALEARFGIAFGIHADAAGERIYYMDRTNNNVREYVPELDTVETIMGAPQPSGWRDGEGDKARFRDPEGVAVAKGGRYVYVADPGNHVVRRFDAERGVVETLAGSPGVAGYADGAGELARLSAPSAVAASADGERIYVADVGNHAVRELDPQSRELTTTSGGPDRIVAFEDGEPAEDAVIEGAIEDAEYGLLGGIAAATERDHIYVSDRSLHRVRVIDLAAGEVRDVAGGKPQPEDSEYDPDGVGDEAIFVAPGGLALAHDDEQLYVADTAHHLIRRVELATQTVDTLAGEYGVPGAFDGVGEEAAFRSPHAVAVGAEGEHLYVTDRVNHAIRRLHIDDREVDTPLGELGRAGGSGEPAVPLDTARFYFPSGLSVVDEDLVITSSQALYRGRNAAAGDDE